jgi:xylulokinase
MLLGLDVGTSSLKAALYAPDGRLVARVAQGYATHTPQRGWAEQHPEDWWQAACTCIRALLAQPGVRAQDIAGIGIAGQSWAAVLVDEDGHALCPTPLWMDTRAQAQCGQANRALGQQRIYQTGMNALHPSYTLPKLLWYRAHHPQLLKKTHRVLQSNGYLVSRLTGQYTQDVSQGYGFAFFDMRTLRWDEELRSAFGIPAHVLPDIVPCHQVAGHVTRQAAAATGLLAGTPVVAGGLDAACGTLGAGVVDAGQTQEQGGQAGGMSICLDKPMGDPRLIISPHVVPGRWLLQGGTVGGGVLRWLQQVFALQGTGTPPDFDRMNDLAASIPAGSDGLVLLPYLAGERSPIWDAQAVGVFYGLDYRTTGAHMIRAAMEGAALALRHNLHVAQQAGAQVMALHAVGGAARSPAWVQIKADITGIPMHVMPDVDHTAQGAAMLAGLGTGVYRDAQHAVQACVGEGHTVYPNTNNRAVYERAYRIYRALYENLRSTMQASAAT